MYLRKIVDRHFHDPTTLTQYALPQLHANDAEYEEDEETEQQYIAEHRQRVQQQHDQNAHTLRGIRKIVIEIFKNVFEIKIK